MSSLEILEATSPKSLAGGLLFKEVARGCILVPKTKAAFLKKNNLTFYAMRMPNDGARVERDLMNSGAGEFAGLWPKQVMAAHGWNGIGTGSPVQSTGGGGG